MKNIKTKIWLIVAMIVAPFVIIGVSSGIASAYSCSEFPQAHYSESICYNMSSLYQMRAVVLCHSVATGNNYNQYGAWTTGGAYMTTSFAFCVDTRDPVRGVGTAVRLR